MQRASSRAFKLINRIGLTATTASLLMVMMLSSCGPRPPVIRAKTEPVIDFIESEEGMRNSETDTQAYGIKKLRSDYAPLLPEYFDPYVPLTDEYVLSKGDVLEISVFGNEDTLVNEVVIAPDGRIYYMFLPGILAEGRNINALKDELTQAISDYFINPEISIIPIRIAGQTFSILGKVRGPGVYPIQGSLTLRQAIGEAGGVSVGGYAGTTINISNLRESFIVRGGRKLDVDFEKLVNTDGYDQNIFVRPGDYIYIASSLVQDVFLLGDVREQKPIPYKDGLTLTAVLAGVSGTTEGWTDRADIRKVLIVRGALDCPVTYEVDVLDILYGKARDVFLLPGDIVYAQKKPFRFGRDLVRGAIETFVRSFGGRAGGHYADEHWLKDD